MHSLLSLRKKTISGKHVFFPQNFKFSYTRLQKYGGRREGLFSPRKFDGYTMIFSRPSYLYDS